MNEQGIGLGITALEESSGYLFASNNSTLIWDGDAIVLFHIYDQDLNLYTDLILLRNE